VFVSPDTGQRSCRLRLRAGGFIASPTDGEVGRGFGRIFVMPENRTASRLFLPLAIACSSCAATAAQAQSANPANPSPTTALPEVVVTAQRVAQPLTDVLADVTYIDRDQVRRSGAVTVADLLQRQPGLEMSRSGGPGNPTSVFTRGAGSEFTAVYIDGVRVDNQAGSGGAPWEAIALDQIDHIEILRGPAAAV
jgi:vitamin B12 transporter